MNNIDIDNFNLVGFIAELDEECAKAIKEAREEEDTECAHMTADSVLCYALRRLGLIDTVIEFNMMHKWYA